MSGPKTTLGKVAEAGTGIALGSLASVASVPFTVAEIATGGRVGRETSDAIFSGVHSAASAVGCFVEENKGAVGAGLAIAGALSQAHHVKDHLYGCNGIIDNRNRNS